MFIGDSRIRQLYRAFVSVLAEEENIPPYVKHGDMHYQHEDSKSRVVSIVVVANQNKSDTSGTETRIFQDYLCHEPQFNIDEFHKKDVTPVC